jgi:hypothetical protein
MLEEGLKSEMNFLEGYGGEHDIIGEEAEEEDVVPDEIEHNVA